LTAGVSETDYSISFGGEDTLTPLGSLRTTSQKSKPSTASTNSTPRNRVPIWWLPMGLRRSSAPREGLLSRLTLRPRILLACWDFGWVSLLGFLCCWDLGSVREAGKVLDRPVSGMDHTPPAGGASTASRPGTSVQELPPMAMPAEDPLDDRPQRDHEASWPHPAPGPYQHRGAARR